MFSSLSQFSSRSSLLSKIFLFFSVFTIFTFLSGNIFSENTFANHHAETITPIQIFTNPTCAHCEAEKKYLKENNIPFTEFIISQHKELYQKTSKELGVFGAPITLAGNTVFQGYNNDETGKKIIETYNNSDKKYDLQKLEGNYEKIGLYGIKSAVCTEDSTMCSIPENPKFTVPFLGEFEIHTESTLLRYSSSFILGLLDGFNPCAMWVLIMFIITLIQIGDKLKMVFVAGTFLIAETIMYGLILVAWWKFFNVFSLDYAEIINIIVGIIAVGAGIFFLYEGIFTDGTCKVTNQAQQRSISQKISKIASSPISWAAFGGILTLALSVNIIEFACSAGYPQVFTNILNSLDGDLIHKIGLLCTYMFAYMLDDIIIFGIALYSIEKLGITQKYAKYTNIFGGVLMVFIGIYMSGLLG